MFFSISSQLGWNGSLMIQQNDNQQVPQERGFQFEHSFLNGNFNFYGKSGKSTGLKSGDEYSV